MARPTLAQKEEAIRSGFMLFWESSFTPHVDRRDTQPTNRRCVGFRHDNAIITTWRRTPTLRISRHRRPDTRKHRNAKYGGMVTFRNDSP